MTGGDMLNYAGPWDWDNFDDYFAPRRALAAFRWDMTFLEFHSLSIETLAQFDLNGKNENLHSQYGEVRADLFPSGKLNITAGALCEIIETSEGGEGEVDLAAALGGLVRLRTEMPGSPDDGMTFAVKFTSGSWNDNSVTFTPVSSSAQGFFFPGTLADLCLISTDYALRLSPVLYMESALRYFLRTSGNALTEGKNTYGGELWASLAWQPFDDIRFSLGSGVFFSGTWECLPFRDRPAVESVGQVFAGLVGGNNETSHYADCFFRGDFPSFRAKSPGRSPGNDRYRGTEIRRTDGMDARSTGIRYRDGNGHLHRFQKYGRSCHREFRPYDPSAYLPEPGRNYTSGRNRNG
jgi:hypothetical protein